MEDIRFEIRPAFFDSSKSKEMDDVSKRSFYTGLVPLPQKKKKRDHHLKAF